MKQIKLTNSGLFTLVDDEDFDVLSRHIWLSAKRRKLVYAYTVMEGMQVFMHHLVCPNENPDLTPDHKNGNGLDNRKENLRLATCSQQMANQKKRQFNIPTTSKYKGVCLRQDTNKWTVGIKVNYKRINLGCFDSEIDAAKAYNRAARRYYGEFAILNIIETEKVQ